MVNQKELFDALSEMGVDFFTGVPDSLLNDFCLYMTNNMTAKQHVMAANEGNAIVQVIDVNGRIISTEAINGCANVNVNAAKGVYMLRLINNDNVKTQKVVVR